MIAVAIRGKAPGQIKARLAAGDEIKHARPGDAGLLTMAV
jgi:hypothetical protein